MKELLRLIDAVVNSADDEGCYHDPDDEYSIPLTVVDKNALEALKAKRQEMRG